MIKTGRFILRLTLRLELYITFIVVPLVFIFGQTSRSRSVEETQMQNIASLACTILMFFIGTTIRAIILSRILRKIKKEKGDIVRHKIKLLNYPRVEVILISFRWIISLILIAAAQMLVSTFDEYRYFTYVLLILMSVTVNAIISFFATENKISELMKYPQLAAIPLPAGSYKQVGIPTRLLMTVVAVLVIPLVILGYNLFLMNIKLSSHGNVATRIFAVIFLSVITLAVIIYESTRGIRSGMKISISTLEQLAQGKFNIEGIPMLDRSEIGTISQYVNVLAASLRNFTRKNSALNEQLSLLTVKLTKNAESMSQNTREEATSMEEIMATTEEISSGAESATHSVEDQYIAMESLIKSMEDLSNVMAGVTSRIESVVQLSSNIETTAETSASTLNAMIESLKIVSESSAQMTSIIEIINDISDKINLLSLNASIEAARAGEAGRGFAVVADEVSKLADMTANSIKDISSLVQRNIDEIRTGMKRIDDTVETIGSITKLVNSINAQTSDISGQMKTQHDINEKVNQEAGVIKQKSDIVKVAIEEQKQALAEIVKAIAGINEATQKTVESADTLFNSAKEVDGMAAELLKE